MPKQLQTEKRFRPFYIKTLIEKQGDEENYIIRGVFSNEEEDRQGDVLIQEGLDVTEYMLNPVVLFAHDHWQPAIGKVIQLYRNSDGNWEGAVQFAAKEYDFAMVLYRLYKGQYMRAFSLSFDAFDTEYDETNDRYILKRSKLYELSVVNVPAVAMALAKQNGIETKSLERYQKYQIRIREKILSDKSAACRMEGESEEDCVGRKIPELLDEGYDQEQADAIAYSVCGKRCGEDKEDKKEIEEDEPDCCCDCGVKLTKETVAIYKGKDDIEEELCKECFEKRINEDKGIKTLKKAKKTLTEVLKAKKNNTKVDKNIKVKELNVAIRQLLKAKKTIRSNK